MTDTTNHSTESIGWKGARLGVVLSFWYALILTVLAIIGISLYSAVVFSIGFDGVIVISGIVLLSAFGCWLVLAFAPSAYLGAMTEKLLNKIILSFHDRLTPAKAIIIGVVVATIVAIGIASVFWAVSWQFSYLLVAGIPSVIYIVASGRLAYELFLSYSNISALTPK
jgi:hypothetical protein